MEAKVAMNSHHEFLNPLCSASTIDLFIVRRAILGALRAELANFEGVVLDIGCGHMPYKSLILHPPSRANKYVGLDIRGEIYRNKPHVLWDGEQIPLGDSSVDNAIATEVFEHCPAPEKIMREACRVLKPGRLIFFTVPFLWPLHDVPHDECRFTPFALKRHLLEAGFSDIKLNALGGWNASLAQLIGLWARRGPMSPRKRAVVSKLMVPVVRYLYGCDSRPQSFEESTMITGLSGTAVKPVA